MTVATSTFVIILAFYANNVHSECSFIEPVEKLSTISTAKAYTVLRYENGNENSTSCIESYVTATGVTEIYMKPDGTSESSGGKFKLSKCDPGKLITEGTIIPNTRFAVYEDTEFGFIIFRACYENTDYLWVAVEEKHPCKPVLKKMYSVLKTMKLDGPPIYRSCFDSY